MPEEKKFATYDEFFAYYLQQHSDHRNRILHAVGTLLGVAIVVAAFVLRHPVYALAGPVAGYGFGWIGHFLVEGNKPASFQHPYWSFISDFRMLWLMATGKLQQRAQNNSSC